jgi:hypothetical protein
MVQRSYKSPLLGEGVDATPLQTQAYEASASPIFCLVLWPCVGEMLAMN